MKRWNGRPPGAPFLPEDDPRVPARGVALGFALGIAFWLAVYVLTSLIR